MINLNTKTYMEIKKEAGIGEVAGKAWRGLKAVTDNPLYKGIMRGTSTDTLISGIESALEGYGVDIKPRLQKLCNDILKELKMSSMPNNVRITNYNDLPSKVREIVCYYTGSSTTSCTANSSCFNNIKETILDISELGNQYSSILSDKSSPESPNQTVFDSDTEAGKKIAEYFTNQLHKTIINEVKDIHSVVVGTIPDPCP